MVTGKQKTELLRKMGEIMALSKKPVTGMKDILPEEMEIRDYVIGGAREGKPQVAGGCVLWALGK